MTIDELEKLEDLLDGFQAEMMEGTKQDKIKEALKIVREQIRIEVKP